MVEYWVWKPSSKEGCGSVRELRGGGGKEKVYKSHMEAYCLSIQLKNTDSKMHVI